MKKLVLLSMAFAASLMGFAKEETFTFEFNNTTAATYTDASGAGMPLCELEVDAQGMPILYENIDDKSYQLNQYLDLRVLQKCGVLKDGNCFYLNWGYAQSPLASVGGEFELNSKGNATIKSITFKPVESKNLKYLYRYLGGDKTVGTNWQKINYNASANEPVTVSYETAVTGDTFCTLGTSGVARIASVTVTVEISDEVAKKATTLSWDWTAPAQIEEGSAIDVTAAKLVDADGNAVEGVVYTAAGNVIYDNGKLTAGAYANGTTGSLTASFPGNDEYEAAEPLTKNFTITRKLSEQVVAPTVTVTAFPGETDGIYFMIDKAKMAVITNTEDATTYYTLNGGEETVADASITKNVTHDTPSEMATYVYKFYTKKGDEKSDEVTVTLKEVMPTIVKNGEGYSYTKGSKIVVAPAYQDIAGSPVPDFADVKCYYTYDDPESGNARFAEAAAGPGVNVDGKTLPGYVITANKEMTDAPIHVYYSNADGPAVDNAVSSMAATENITVTPGQQGGDNSGSIVFKTGVSNIEEYSTVAEFDANVYASGKEYVASVDLDNGGSTEKFFGIATQDRGLWLASQGTTLMPPGDGYVKITFNLVNPIKSGNIVVRACSGKKNNPIYINGVKEDLTETPRDITIPVDGEISAITIENQDVPKTLFMDYSVYVQSISWSDPTGVDSIGMENGEAIYFDLNGNRVDADNLARGIYVRVSGGKAVKIVK